MTTFRSSFFRPYGALLKGSVILGLLLAGWMGFVATVMWSNEKHPRPFKNAAVARHPFFAIPATLALLIGLPLVAANFVNSRGRYRLGPTALEIEEGWLGRKTRTIPYETIKSADPSRGPVMRLLGTADLTVKVEEMEIYTVYGIRDADGVRDHLLARRDSLLELNKAEEEASSLRAVQRLAAVLERLEKRLA